MQTRPATPTFQGTIDLDRSRDRYRIWGGGNAHRWFADEELSALFERTLHVETVTPGATITWRFTGRRGGFDVVVEPGKLSVRQRFYDSAGYGAMTEAGGARASVGERLIAETDLPQPPSLLRVVLDHKLNLRVTVDADAASLKTRCVNDVTRHQITLDGEAAKLKATVSSPPTRRATVRVDRGLHFQSMLGWGGILSRGAFRRLSDAGRQRWYDLVRAYNLLILREYPVGQSLNEAFDNFDAAGIDVPHYYGSNFPNGESSDFEYLKRVREVGGVTLFEFWRLPAHIEESDDRTARYAEAMVAYCRTHAEKTGEPPEIVGLQNEVGGNDPKRWAAFTVALRREPDQAGFGTTRIYFADASHLSNSVRRTRRMVREAPEAWREIDFAAGHMYDYQATIGDPDAFDATLLAQAEAGGAKSFLSTELCINAEDLQYDAYRLALSMGQLYHKNLTLLDAVAICYCWTLVDVEEPNFAWTRSLFWVDVENNYVPTPTSHQLRVFGAYSRRICRGMVRAGCEASDGDLLPVAFVDTAAERQQTLVLLNRGTATLDVAIDWPDAELTVIERVSPSKLNEVSPHDPAQGNVSIAPGEIVTLSNVPLRSEIE